MGEQWSPKMAPEKTAPTMAATMVWLPVNCQATLTPMGVTMPIVPHDVPVEKAMNADRRKIVACKTAGWVFIKHVCVFGIIVFHYLI
jgi:hypothetical protein